MSKVSSKTRYEVFMEWHKWAQHKYCTVEHDAHVNNNDTINCLVKNNVYLTQIKIKISLDQIYFARSKIGFTEVVGQF